MKQVKMNSEAVQESGQPKSTKSPNYQTMILAPKKKVKKVALPPAKVITTMSL